MSEYEIEMIRVLGQMGNTDWVGIGFNVLCTLLTTGCSAWIAFGIAKYQTDKQLTRQNVLDTKKEKTTLVTQIKLDKYEDLFQILVEFNSLVTESYFNTFFYIDPIQMPNSPKFTEIKEIERKLAYEINMRRFRLDVLTSYYPSIKDDWVTLLDLYFEIKTLIDNRFLATNNFTCSIPDPSFDEFHDKHVLFISKSNNIADRLTKAIIGITSDLENDLDSNVDFKKVEQTKNI